MARVKLFFDFWNFQLDWNRLVGKDSGGDPIRVPWRDLVPKVLPEAVARKREEDMAYAGAHVYASVDPDGDDRLRRFLHAMEAFPGYTVLVKQRRSTWGGIRCSSCRADIETCPKCNERLRRTVEKGIDTAIVTDMIQMAFDDVYDVAILGSTDADLCPAVTFIFQRIGKPVYNLWFPGVGHNLRNACYDHFPMSDLLTELGVPE